MKISANGDGTTNGAGLFVVGSNVSPNVTNCTFYGNFASAGGAVWVDTAARIDMTLCTFDTNVASRPSGSQTVLGGGAVFVNSTATAPSVFRSCLFTHNEADYEDGGAIEASGGARFRCLNCLFDANAAYGVNTNSFPAGGNGGAVHLYSDAVAVLNNCVFQSNSANTPFGTDAGGGGLWANKEAVINSTNCLFFKNITDGVGGAIASSGSRGTYYNLTATENDAASPTPQSGGVYVNNFNSTSTVSHFTNAVLFNNGPAVTMRTVFLNLYDANSATVVNYSDVESGWTGAGGNNIANDPVFVDAASNNYRLKVCSPCINAGDVTNVPTDLDDLNKNTAEDCSGSCGDPPGERIPDLDLAQRVALGNTNTTGTTESNCKIGCSYRIDMGSYEFGSCAVPGDMNGDGVTDGQDIQGFVDCLLVPITAQAGTCICGDFDRDGFVTTSDIPCFIQKELFGVSACEIYTSCGLTDCNSNGSPDSLDIAIGVSHDCNTNGTPDECDIAAHPSHDADTNGIPDECQADCDTNGIIDTIDICSNGSIDCDTNGTPDDCDLAVAPGLDCNTDGILDVCELGWLDCNTDGRPDDCDIWYEWSEDCNTNGVPDECEETDCGSDEGRGEMAMRRSGEDSDTNSAHARQVEITAILRSMHDLPRKDYRELTDLQYIEMIYNDVCAKGFDDACDFAELLESLESP